MPLAAASLYNFEARKSAPALGRRAAPTSLGQRAAPQALGANSSAAAAERRLWKWYVDRLLMFDQYETPPQWEVGGEVAEFAAPHFHIVPGKSRPEAAALHLQRAWRTQRARREWAARTIQLRVQALQSRRAAARLTPAELEQRQAHRAAARSARQASVAKGSMEARELSARHHALFHGDLDGSRRRAAAASAPAYGVGACGGPAPTFSSPGRQRRCTTVAEMAERGGTWRRGGLHQEFMRGAHGGRVRADKQHARARRARSSPRAALRPSWRVARAAARRRAGASAASARAAPPPLASTTRQGRRCLRMRSSTATATAGAPSRRWASAAPAAAVPTGAGLHVARATRRRRCSSHARCPRSTFNACVAAPAARRSARGARRGGRRARRRRHTRRTHRVARCRPCRAAAAAPTARCASRCLARVMSQFAPRHARQATHARRAPDARRRAVARRGGRRARPAPRRTPRPLASAAPPHRRSGTRPRHPLLAARRRARRAPRDRPRGRRRRRRARSC